MPRIMTTFTIYQWRKCYLSMCVCRVCVCVSVWVGNYVQFSLLSKRRADSDSVSVSVSVSVSGLCSARWRSRALRRVAPPLDALHNLHCFRFPHNYYLYNMYKFQNASKTNEKKKHEMVKSWRSKREREGDRKGDRDRCRFYGHLTNK